MNSLAVSVCMMLMSGSFSAPSAQVGPLSPAAPGLEPAPPPVSTPYLAASDPSPGTASTPVSEDASVPLTPPARLRVADIRGDVTRSANTFSDLEESLRRLSGRPGELGGRDLRREAYLRKAATYPAGLAKEEIEFVELTNYERALKGLKPLEVDMTLVQAARGHSREMYDKFYFAHDSPTASLRTPMKRYLKALDHYPRYAMIGENIAYCSEVNVAISHNALMKSEGHRANILDDRYDAIGVGVCKGADGSFYVTEMFLGRTPR